MKHYTKAFKALWSGEIISEFGGAAGGIINGLLLYELTGSKEWMGALWLVYFIPSLVLQGFGAPFLNYVSKEKTLRNIQLVRAGSYLLPLVGFMFGEGTGAIIGLVVLQCILGLLQSVYASMSFSLLPDICDEKELASANGLLDGTIRLMSFLAPGVTSLLLLASPIHYLYAFSAALFFGSYLALRKIPASCPKKGAVWTRRFWWSELTEGYTVFFKHPQLLRLTLLSSTVQFAVGAAIVLGVPFIRGDLNGQAWEYAVFSGAFPVGYALGMLLLMKLPKNPVTMYLGLIGGGASFLLLFLVKSVPAAVLCELFGGILFPLFNAQSASIFQKEAPRERLTQLSAVRLLFLRLTMPLGILFASASFIGFSTRQLYAVAGTIIVVPGLISFFAALSFFMKKVADRGSAS